MTASAPAKPNKGTGLPPAIVYYCKDCRALRDVKRDAHRYVYMCAACGTKNVAFGTLRSIKGFYRLKEEDLVVKPISEKGAGQERDEKKAALKKKK